MNQIDFKIMYKKIHQDFPEVFNKKRYKPLEVGITTKLFEYYKNDFSKYKIKEFMYYWTNSVFYLIAMQKKDFRINLEGKTVGYISDIEKEYSKIKFKKLHDNYFKKK